jgi:hypothetical protein
MKNEGDVKKAVKKILDKHGWYWWMPPANGFGRAGIADINAVHAGVFMAIETKFGSNKPTPMQVGFLASIRAEGGFAFVVNEKRVDTLAKFLDAFARSIDAGVKGGKVADEDGALMLDCIREMQLEF